MALSKLRGDATGVTYALPSDPDFTVRFKYTNQMKSLSGIPVRNNVTEIIINDTSDVVLGSETVPEALSIRIKVSGSHAAKARKDALIAAVSAQLATWASENVFEGFEPTTAPAEPV